MLTLGTPPAVVTLCMGPATELWYALDTGFRGSPLRGVAELVDALILFFMLLPLLK